MIGRRERSLKRGVRLEIGELSGRYIGWCCVLGRLVTSHTEPGCEQRTGECSRELTYELRVGTIKSEGHWVSRSIRGQGGNVRGAGATPHVVEAKPGLYYCSIGLST